MARSGVIRFALLSVLAVLQLLVNTPRALAQPNGPSGLVPSAIKPSSDVTGAALGAVGDMESEKARKAREEENERYASRPFPPAPRVVPMSLQQAVDASLRNNLDILVSRFDPLLLEKDVVSAKAHLYDPTFLSNFSYGHTSTPTASIFIPSGAINERTAQWGFGISQPTTIGGIAVAQLQTIRTRTNSPINLLTDTFQPTLSLTITQSLLKNFGWNVNRIAIRRSVIGQSLSMEALRQQVINSVFDVQQAYWNLVGARENLKVQRLALRLAEDLLRQNEIQVKVGTMAPLDVLQAKAQEKAAETDVIVAENAVRTAQDVLLKLTTPDNEMLTQDLRIETTDKPEFKPVKIDFAEKLRTALSRRPDLKAAVLNIQDKALVKKGARNAVLPQVDFTFNAGLTGLSGDPNPTVNPFSGGSAIPVVNAVPNPATPAIPPLIPGTTTIGFIPPSAPSPAGAGVALTPFAGQSSFKDATSTFFTNNEFSFWSVGIVVTYPIGNRDARAQYAKSKLDLEKSQKSLTRTEQQATLDVKTAVENMDAVQRGVVSTREAREVAEQQLDAEEKKLAVGLSTNFQVLQYQKDLTDRRLNEVTALTLYETGLASLAKATGTTLDGLNIDFLEEH
jgi:outer membrane protein TolC